VETYGVAKYQEANPAFFTVITFPFLFGVMFGDIGHGMILFGFGIYMVFWKETIQNSIIKMLLPHRYMLTMMGFFATYCGFIYNDYLSTSLNLFGSCYTV
jgi:V-type H+-transporting ATPase subunit a